MTSHLDPSHLVSSHRILSRLISSRLFSSCLVSPHLVSSCLTSSRLVSSLLILSRLILYVQVPVFLLRCAQVPVCLPPQVCSGWSQVTWRVPQDSQVDGVVVENRGSSSVLQLFNVTWRNSGRYTCEEGSSYQSREIDIFIPGKGDNIYHIWLREAEEDTIPCVVSDPRLNVSLYERPSWTLVTGTTYEPGRGFTGRLNDTSYVCLAALGGEERESQVYYVFSIVGELMRLG
uniref:Ig-like domain-containing protein n=1 Tax=Seriola lalandi dorsalis TaxID=1841481 RepID=A0A3B4YEY5_SERLL